jgi:hypothetical protein
MGYMILGGLVFKYKVVLYREQGFTTSYVYCNRESRLKQGCKGGNILSVDVRMNVATAIVSARVEDPFRTKGSVEVVWNSVIEWFADFNVDLYPRSVFEQRVQLMHDRFRHLKDSLTPHVITAVGNADRGVKDKTVLKTIDGMETELISLFIMASVDYRVRCVDEERVMRNLKMGYAYQIEIIHIERGKDVICVEETADEFSLKRVGLAIHGEEADVVKVKVAFHMIGLNTITKEEHDVCLLLELSEYVTHFKDACERFGIQCDFSGMEKMCAGIIQHVKESAVHVIGVMEEKGIYEKIFPQIREVIDVMGGHFVEVSCEIERRMQR